jgi:hypothetical protein
MRQQTRPSKEGCSGHPKGDAQALFGRGDDPDRSGRREAAPWRYSRRRTSPRSFWPMLRRQSPWHCPTTRWSQHRDRECQLAVGPMTPVRRLAHDGDDALGS